MHVVSFLYLNEIVIGLALFDAEVSIDMKLHGSACSTRMRRQCYMPPKRVRLNDSTLLDKQLPDFASTNTNQLFSALNIRQQFLKKTS